MKFLMFTESKKLLGKYSVVEKFFYKWRWNCEIIDNITYNHELFRYFYEVDSRTPLERLHDDEYYIDEL